MKKKKKTDQKDLPILNGLSISEMELDQEGNLTVNFDLPVTQESTHYALSVSGTRTLDVYQYPDLQKLCRDLFQAARKHMMEDPDEDMAKANCDRCREAPCCRNYNVIITDADVDQLREDMPREEFIKKFTDPAVDWAGDYKYQLKNDTDETGEKCIFLKRDKQGRMRCSVYDRRGKICRSFDVAICDEMDDMDENEE